MNWADEIERHHEAVALREQACRCLVDLDDGTEWECWQPICHDGQCSPDRRVVLR